LASDVKTAHNHDEKSSLARSRARRNAGGMSVSITAYDHVGLRVTSAARALAFYADLGFEVDPNYSSERVAEIVNRAGIRLNLIFNGAPRANNILLDEPTKHPGYTHAAFIVDRLDDILAWAAERGVVITEGPVNWGRRLTCFLRDPDGNVLEFNELIADAQV
jgi:catechol 2,3-dioxygenase-like lactoylglutathione lyase family enzyme